MAYRAICYPDGCGEAARISACFLPGWWQSCRRDAQLPDGARDAELFAEQQVFILQRLLVEHATGVIPYDLSHEERLMIALSLIGTGSIIEAISKTATDHAHKLEDWLAFFVQNKAYNTKPSPMGEIARAQRIYVSIARDPRLAQHDKYCRLDEWVMETTGSRSKSR